jgi:hypothetical protein
MADQDWKTVALEKLAELFHVILTLVGIAVVILAASKTAKFRGLDLSIQEPVPRTLLAAFGILVIILAMYMWRIGGGTGVRTLKAKTYYDINIVSPSPGGSVGPTGKGDVSGTIKKRLPNDYCLWVFRVYDDGRIYPLKQCNLNDEKGTWIAHNCDRGSTFSGRRWFSVNIVGPDGIALISYVRAAGEKFKPIRDELVSISGNNNVAYLPSVTLLPKDTVEAAKVEVTA